MPDRPELSITLYADEWQIVLDALQDGRHRIVAPVLQRIIEQAQQAQQTQASQQEPPRHLSPVS